MKKKVNESATSGATSAGAVASVNTGLHFPLIKRMPPSTLFGGYEEVQTDSTKKSKKRKKR